MELKCHFKWRELSDQVKGLTGDGEAFRVEILNRKKVSVKVKVSL